MISIEASKPNLGNVAFRLPDPTDGPPAAHTRSILFLSLSKTLIKVYCHC